jgi:small subunit ribosomal protein S1
VDEGSTRAAGAMASSSAIAPGARVTGKVERHEKFGVLVFLGPGRSGLMPLSETGLVREADPVKAFPVGSELDVVVLEVDPAGRRIRVSHKAVQAAKEADEVHQYAQRSDAAPPNGFGSFADRLRGALEPGKR